MVNNRHFVWCKISAHDVKTDVKKLHVSRCILGMCAVMVHPQIINVSALLSWLCDACAGYFNLNRYLIHYETSHLPLFLPFFLTYERNSDLTQFGSLRMRRIDMMSKCTATVAELWVLYDDTYAKYTHHLLPLLEEPPPNCAKTPKRPIRQAACQL